MKKILYTTTLILLGLLLVLGGCKDPKEDLLFGAIYGMVSVAGTAEPMRGTGVELYYLNEQGGAGALLLRTTTANDGSYSFEDVKAGEYLLRVEVPGYKRTEYKVVVEAGRSARADMQVIAKGEGDEETDAYYIIKAAKLMVQKEDLGYGWWATADAMCKGSTVADYTDWRLPTKEELMVLYTNRILIGGFKNGRYWSGSYHRHSDYYNKDYYYYINFSDGTLASEESSRDFNIRAVRTVSPTTPEESYVILPVVNLMVQKEDLGTGTFSTAKALCEASILADYTDWRLPTEEELMVLYTNRNLIGGFQSDGYWSGTSDGSWHSYVNFANGTLHDCNALSVSNRIRAVRTITE